MLWVTKLDRVSLEAQLMIRSSTLRDSRGPERRSRLVEDHDSGEDGARATAMAWRCPPDISGDRRIESGASPSGIDNRGSLAGPWLGS